MATDLQPAGMVASSPEEATNLENAGYSRCLNPTCDHWWSPERLESHDEYDELECPSCQKRYNMLDPTPFSSNNGGSGTFAPGGHTHVGLSMRELGQIGERLIRGQGQVPGYGPITWWSEEYNSPLDGATKDWGIEVKTICIDGKSHKFIAGGTHERGTKNAMMAERGYQGVLAILVILDFRRSVADVYLQEQPLAPWQAAGRYGPGTGPMVQGIANYRPQHASHLIQEIPFDNPFLRLQNREPQTTEIPF